MTEEIKPAPTAPSPTRETERGGYTKKSAPAAVVDSRLTGGSGVQRSHLRDRKTWLKNRTRAGQTWAQRKANSLTYCPAKTRA
jgi:hypothetical protein